MNKMIKKASVGKSNKGNVGKSKKGSVGKRTKQTSGSNKHQKTDDVASLSNQQQSPVGIKSVGSFTSETMIDLPAITDASSVASSPEIFCEFHQLSTSWRSILGNCNMSDVTVQITRDNMSIPAHKLVLYVRCKKILPEIVTVESGQQLIVLNNCGQIACNAFLEYIYCSTVNNLSQLSNADLHEMIELARKYGVGELLTFIEERSSESSDQKQNSESCTNSNGRTNSPDESLSTLLTHVSASVLGDHDMITIKNSSLPKRIATVTLSDLSDNDVEMHQLNEKNDEKKLTEEVNNSADDTITLSSDSEAC